MCLQSEEFVRDYMLKNGNKDGGVQQGQANVQIATKYFPIPWRLTTSTVPEALRASLARLGLPKCSLYQQHW